MRILLFAFLGFVLAGCVTTSEIQLRQDVWQIRASGGGETANALFERAAELTIEKGYTHFVLGVPQTRGSFSTAGFTPIEANVVGDDVFVSGGEPINVYRETSSVLVKMSRSETGGALNASTVLASIK